MVNFTVKIPLSFIASPLLHKPALGYPTELVTHKQVEATTGKRAEVRGQDGPFFQDTKRPGKTARPALTGPWI